MLGFDPVKILESDDAVFLIAIGAAVKQADQMWADKTKFAAMAIGRAVNEGKV